MTPQQDHATSGINPGTPRSVQHFEIATAAPGPTRAFLERVFGWTFESHDAPGGGSYDTFQMPDGTGGGVSTPLEGRSPGIVPYVNVDDLEDALALCKNAGAEIVVPIQDVPHQGRFFWFSVAGGPALGCWEPAR